MALALGLEQAGKTATRVETKAAVTVEKVGQGFEIMLIKLTVRATVPGIDKDSFHERPRRLPRRRP